MVPLPFIHPGYRMTDFRYDPVVKKASTDGRPRCDENLHILIDGLDIGENREDVGRHGVDTEGGERRIAIGVVQTVVYESRVSSLLAGWHHCH